MLAHAGSFVDRTGVGCCNLYIEREVNVGEKYKKQMLQDTMYGFKYGPVLIERFASHPGWGVLLGLSTDKETLEVRVTPSGLFRVGKPTKKGK